MEEEMSVLSQLVDIEIGRREKRPLCSRCSRPRGVCWCGGLGGAVVGVRSRVIVLQHPNEEKRCLRTAPMLSACLPPSHCVFLRGKRFPLSRFPELAPILASPETILMYPGEGAVDLEGLRRVGCGGQAPYNVIILDGTWQQAKSIYFNCPALHSVRQVCLSGKYTSEYVIRTQPTQDALSTVETAAISLATLEDNWALYDTLVEPLRVLCRHQIQHGAVVHQSKEEMIMAGRCTKPVGKRTYKKLLKCGVRHSEGLLASMVMTGGALGPDITTGTTNSPHITTGGSKSGDCDGYGNGTEPKSGFCVFLAENRGGGGATGANGDVVVTQRGGGDGGDAVVKGKRDMGESRVEVAELVDGEPEPREEIAELVKEGNRDTEMNEKWRIGDGERERGVGDKGRGDREREDKEEEEEESKREREMKVRNISAHISWELR